MNKSPQPSGLTPQQALTLLHSLKNNPAQTRAMLLAEKRSRERAADEKQAAYPTIKEQIWYPGSKGQLLPCDPTASTQSPPSTGPDNEPYRVNTLLE